MWLNLGNQINIHFHSISKLICIRNGDDMARFNINEWNKNGYKEVCFQEGLLYIQDHPGEKLYSDGLEFDEYMIWVDDHYEYEDGCYLGNSMHEIINRTGGYFGSWIPSHKFYVTSS